MGTEMGTRDAWEEASRGPRNEEPGKLVVDLDGYEGPLDMLLDLARRQKVDVTKISILDLAEQYLAFIAELRRLRLEVAADYLVMAAWLAYLKSRLLLPDRGREEDEPSGEEMAAALAFQLRRLEAMREAGVGLQARPHLGREVFPRGAPEGVAVTVNAVYDVTLYDLLKSYGARHRRIAGDTLHIAPSDFYSVDEALARLRDALGRIPDWQSLESFLPTTLQSGLGSRSALAATFAASLELTRIGQAQIRQDRTFGPIHIRRRTDRDGTAP